MASWGLAFQYGKKAYEDMWREQEENERYAATRKLHDMQLAEAEKAQADQTLVNDEERAGRAVITKYKKAIMKGGEDGAKAYAQARTEMGVPTVYLGDGKVGSLLANGQVDPSTIVTMKGDKWNGTAMMSELQKMVPSAEKEAARYDAAVATNRQYQWEADKLKQQLAAQYGVASMYANAKLKAAGMQAGAVRQAMFHDQFIKNNKEIDQMTLSQAARSAFGEGATAVRGEDGLVHFYKMDSKTGWTEFSPDEGSQTAFNNDYGRIYTDTYNGMLNSGTPYQAIVPSVANVLGEARNFGLGVRDQALALSGQLAQTSAAQRVAAQQAVEAAAVGIAPSTYSTGFAPTAFDNMTFDPTGLERLGYALTGQMKKAFPY